jgi:hypothetical protein
MAGLDARALRTRIGFGLNESMLRLERRLPRVARLTPRPRR